MRVIRNPSIVASLALIFIGRGAAAQRVYVAPTPETIISETEERHSDPPAHTIFVWNRSTVPVTVFSVSLNGCENVKQRCGPKPTKLRVGPGQRVIAMRVEPSNPERGFGYRFGFSWQADSSGVAAIAALAASGDPGARERLAAAQRADSIRRAEVGAHYNELTREDFKAIATRATSLRALPESLVIAPGERSSVERIRLLVRDNQGGILGQTHWVRWTVRSQGALDFVPNDILVARRPGRGVVQFRLAEEAQGILTNLIGDAEVPVIVAYPIDPHAPVFTGRALDADSKAPLACARVALEDSAQDAVSTDFTSATGTFVLRAPRPGTYRVRIETRGWVPVYGPSVLANADEEKQQEHLVRFTEQLLMTPYDKPDSFQHAYPAALATEPISTRPAGKGTNTNARSTPIVQGVTLGGSASMPILGLITRVPAATAWMQFVVDSLGRVDTTSVQLQPGSTATMKSSVLSVLPRLRFSPARDAGRPTCELIRMQVNFTPR